MEETSSGKEEPKENDGRVISIIGFILLIVYICLAIIRFFGGIYFPTVGLWPASVILGIAGWVKSKRAGKTNKLAMATVFLVIFVIIVTLLLGTYFRTQY